MVVEQPQFTRVEEPTLLCNHVLLTYAGQFAWYAVARSGIGLNKYSHLDRASPL
jgi:hypothetical protein